MADPAESTSLDNSGESTHTTGEGSPSGGAMPSGQGGGATPSGHGPDDVRRDAADTGQSDTTADKALRAERDARKKAEKELADLRRQQQSGKSDAEVLAQRVAELEAARATAEREALVLKIANELSIPPQLAGRLQGSTEEELRSDAEALKAVIPSSTSTSGPSPSVGGPQGPPATTRSPSEWVKIITGQK